MASSFEIISSSSYDGRKMKLTCTQTGNINTNKSTIKWTLTTYGGTAGYSYSTGPTKVIINGTTVYSKSRVNYDAHTFPAAAGSTSGTLEVAHSSDGTKSISVSLSTAIYYGSASVKTDTKTWTLDTIPRPSTITATNANVGSNSTISISRANSSFTHTLTYSFGSLTGTIATKTTSTSVSWTLPTTFYAQIGASATSKSGTITCETFNGSTSIGTKTATFTATTAKANDAPTLSPSAQVSTSSTTYSLTGSQTIFIKGYSDVSVSTGAAARNSATLSSQKITCGNDVINSGSGTFTTPQSGTFTFSATDSRGYTTTSTLTRTLVDYFKPTCNLTAKMDTTGLITFNADGNFFNKSFGAVNNQATVQYRYKLNGSSTWSSWQSASSVSYGTTTYTATATYKASSYTDKYDVQMRISDKLYTVTSSTLTVTALPVFEWGENDFRFNVPVTFAAGYTQVASAIDDTPVASDFIVEQGTSGDWIYRKWNSGIAECWARKAVNTAVQTAWGNLYVSGALSATNLAFPFTFTAIPMINVNLSGSGSGAFIIASGSGSSSTTNTGIYEIARGTAAAAANYGVNYDVRGRWK